MLALSPAVGYIHEPFNPRPNIPTIQRPAFKGFYTWIDSFNEHLFLPGLQKTLAFRLDLAENFRRRRSSDPRSAFRETLKDWWACTRYRLERRIPLLKDPIALLSAEWLADHFDMRVIVLIRHPAAFIHSIKTRDWRQPWPSLLRQKELVKGRLQPFQELMKRYHEKPYEIADEASAMWNLLYTQVAGYQERRLDWLFLRHEDLSKDPVNQFAMLYDFAGLQYSGEIRETIQAYSSPAPLSSQKQILPGIQRDSRALVDRWKDELSAEEIEIIHANTRGIAERYYCAADW